MRILARAPAKAILLGEHSVNRGQMALAISVGLYATCTIVSAPSQTEPVVYRLGGGGHTQTTTRDEILALGRAIDRYRLQNDYRAIQQLAAGDFFAPTKYVLAAAGEQLPASLDISFTSEIPPSSGLGSGGASFVALAAALHRCLQPDEHSSPQTLASWAWRGDIVAHGGIASGLDTQTSLYGGIIRYTVEHQGRPLANKAIPQLVIGNSGVSAATSEVNGRVRWWLEERPARIHYFQEVGLLARLAEDALSRADWPLLGHLMNLNQLLLERIGVSCPELETLIDASLEAGALGAKLSGSGGGGIMIALVPDQASIEPVAAAITASGGTAIIAPIGVPGVTVNQL